nr:MAG TPA: hypothetical protein [Bacteriophage sp.]
MTRPKALRLSRTLLNNSEKAHHARRVRINPP